MDIKRSQQQEIKKKLRIQPKKKKEKQTHFYITSMSLHPLASTVLAPGIVAVQPENHNGQNILVLIWTVRSQLIILITKLQYVPVVYGGRVWVRRLIKEVSAHSSGGYVTSWMEHTPPHVLLTRRPWRRRSSWTPRRRHSLTAAPFSYTFTWSSHIYIINESCCIQWLP